MINLKKEVDTSNKEQNLKKKIYDIFEKIHNKIEDILFNGFIGEVISIGLLAITVMVTVALLIIANIITNHGKKELESSLERITYEAPIQNRDDLVEVSGFEK